MATNSCSCCKTECSFKEALMQGAITMNLLEKLQEISGENVKVDFCRSQLWNPEASKLPVKYKFFCCCCSTLCTPILSVFLWLWCNCWKASYKGSLLIRERYSFRLSWVFLNFPILPFDVRLRVFLQRKVCIFTKRQSLLIYQTYQPASQTDSTRQLEFLKSSKIFQLLKATYYF